MHGTHDAHHSGHADPSAEMLALQAEIFADHTAKIAAWLPVSTPPRTIVDLGCGTGAGTFALLARFPDARVIAVDSAEDHLSHLQRTADVRGVASRVRLVQADLDAVWPDIGPADLVWVANALHHLADPDRALAEAYRMLTPGGLLAVVELTRFARFLPPDGPEFRPGLEQRCHAAHQHRQAERLPHIGADWAAKLTSAGFRVEDTTSLTIEVSGAGRPAVGAYALVSLRRLRQAVTGLVPAEDLAALDDLVDQDSPRCVCHRPDLAVWAERMAWAARRP